VEAAVVTAAPWPRVWNGGPAKPHGEPLVHVAFPCDTRIERNVRAPWSTKRRTQATRRAIEDALTFPAEDTRLHELRESGGPFCVRLTRVSPGKPDRHNLGDALKAAIDAVAFALRIDDGDDGIAFALVAVKGKGPIGLRIEIWGPGSVP